MNQSPWLEILDKNRKPRVLAESVGTDCIIVGGGIAGVTTAYYLLTHTGKKVTLIEADRIAHGATGHNAGHITTVFEIPISSMVAQFGKEITKRSLHAIESTWSMIEDILATTNIRVHYASFIGYGGYPTIEQLIIELENIRQRSEWGLFSGKALVKSDFDFKDIPSHLHQYCEHVSSAKVDDILRVHPKSHYIAAIPEKMGVMNSAHFTDALLKWCLDAFPERFEVFEKSPVTAIEAKQDEVIAIANGHLVAGSEVILCTNGFEHFTLKNEGFDVDTRFHHELHGKIGYMAGFVRKEVYEPMAHWYINANAKFVKDSGADNPYFYVTRRPFYHNHQQGVGLLAVGGPEVLQSDRTLYDRKKSIEASIKDELVHFINTTAREAQDLKHVFFWHGLMGYTTSGVRLIGSDPCNKRIMYNLGCNGIGITTSVFGSFRIAQMIHGATVEPMIFDPRDSRCAVSAPPEYLPLTKKSRS